MLELIFLSLVCMDGVTLGQEKLLDTASHIGVDPMVCGTHPYVRGREHTPKVPNNKLPKKKKICKILYHFIQISKFLVQNVLNVFNASNEYF